MEQFSFDPAEPTRVGDHVFPAALEPPQTPALAVCNECGREVWATHLVGMRCGAPTIGGRLCHGVLTERSAPAPQPVVTLDVAEPDPVLTEADAEADADEEREAERTGQRTGQKSLVRDAPFEFVDARRAAISYEHNWNLFERQIFPFSVLRSHGEEWQRRRRWWAEVGVEPELGGRDANLLNYSRHVRDPDFYSKKRSAEKRVGREMTSAEFMDSEHYTPMKGNSSIALATSVFDPVLAEASYRWWCPPGGVVLDPFAGGAMRGVVAARCGMPYVGNELRGEQVQRNREQAVKIFADDGALGGGYPLPAWHEGDATCLTDHDAVRAALPLHGADFVFSCPPYLDLEVYSDDPRDLSNMAPEQFRWLYQRAVLEACELLREDAFAAFVVGEVREKRGNGAYRKFVSMTVDAFEQAGLEFYNDVIYATAIGTAQIRYPRALYGTAKVTRVHQNLLVFVKGDAKRAAMRVHGARRETDL